jgi:N-acyl homoserine lactone hydrolase
MQSGGWNIDILIQGYPGKTLKHGGLGWSTVTLLRGHGHVAVVDTGSFGARKLIVDGLKQHGLKPADVTDLILSHLHYDHVVNWPMFSHARIICGAQEMTWALAEPPGTSLVPELYVQPLSRHGRLVLVGDGAAVLPGITAYLAPGHTPGHLIFVIEGSEKDVLLVQDAAKYRAELVSRRADMTYDPAVTRASIDRIWTFWRRKTGSIVITGHDLPMVLESGRPCYQGQREAGISAFFGDDIDDRHFFDLSGR